MLSGSLLASVLLAVLLAVLAVLAVLRLELELGFGGVGQSREQKEYIRSRLPFSPHIPHGASGDSRCGAGRLVIIRLATKAQKTGIAGRNYISHLVVLGGVGLWMPLSCWSAVETMFVVALELFRRGGEGVCGGVMSVSGVWSAPILMAGTGIAPEAAFARLNDSWVSLTRAF